MKTNKRIVLRQLKALIISNLTQQIKIMQKRIQVKNSYTKNIKINEYKNSTKTLETGKL